MKFIARHFLLFILLAIVSYALRCVGSGTGTIVDKLPVTGRAYVNRDGVRPVSKAIVYLRFKNYINLSEGFEIKAYDSIMLESVTDDSGNFFFDSIPKGTYFIIGEKDKAKFINSIEINQDSLEKGAFISFSDTLNPTGTLMGKVPPPADSNPVYVCIPGLNEYKGPVHFPQGGTLCFTRNKEGLKAQWMITPEMLQA